MKERESVREGWGGGRERGKATEREGEREEL